MVVFGCLAAAPAAHAAGPLTVNTAIDYPLPAPGSPGDGLCTLREAIYDASFDTSFDYPDCAGATSGTSEIQIPADIPSVTLDTTTNNEDQNVSGDLDVIYGPLTITGLAPGGNTITAGPGATDRVLDVTQVGVDLTLDNLVITGGNLTTPPYSNNLPGGGIRLAGGGTLTLDGTNVTDNSAVGTTGQHGEGGGICAGFENGSSSTLIIKGGSVISRNRAGGGGLAAEDGEGGGIYLVGGGSTIDMTGGEISDNSAGGGGDGTNSNSPGRGGGIAVLSNFADGANTVTLDGVDVQGNSAGGRGSSSQGQGGGIEIDQHATTLTVKGGTTISGNTAGGGSGNAPGYGGGVDVQIDTSNSFSENSQVTNNDAGGAGGTGAGQGGGIWSHDEVSIEDSTFSNNRASSNATGTVGGVGAGGGIYMTDWLGEPLTITDSTINGNRAGVTASGSGGGGVADLDTGLLTISGGQIRGNTAANRGGGIYRSMTANDTTGGTDKIETSLISDNTARDGGGVWSEISRSMALTQSTVAGNTARGTTGSTALGGGLALSSLNDTIGETTRANYLVENSTIADNTANTAGDATPGGDGGGIATQASGGSATLLAPNLTLLFATVGGNAAVRGSSEGGQGGNLFLNDVDAGDVDLQGSVISDGSGASGAENCETDTGTIASGDGNVEGPSSAGGAATNQCNLTGIHDVRADPLLGPLLDNGGPDIGNSSGTLLPLTSRLPSPAGPAFDRAPGGVCDLVTVDEYDNSRGSSGETCDAGAIELGTKILTVDPPTNGSITGTGINCPGDCTEAITQGSTVALTAVPSNGFVLDAWTGACSGSGACNAYLNVDKTVGATFVVAPPPPPPGDTETPPTASPTTQPSKPKCKKKEKKKRSRSAVAAKKCKKKRK